MIKFVEIEPTLKERLSLLGSLLFKRVIRIEGPYLNIVEKNDD
jgi:hypothetical protein